MFGIRQLIVVQNFLNRTSQKALTSGELSRRDYTCRISKECGPCAKHQYMDPQCKVGLVTGGATGIGLAIANELLAHHFYRVVISGTDPCVGKAAAKQLNETHGKDKACFIHMNVNCSKQFDDVFKEMLAKFGNVDVLVNNAAILQDSRWEYEVDTNLKSIVRGTLTGFKHMKDQKNKGGVIINTIDTAAFETFPGAPVYTGTKYGVLGLTRSFGDQSWFENTGVRVVGLCPGTTETVMVKESEKNQLTKELGSKTKADLMAKPIQKPASVGKGAVYLLQYAPTGTVWVVEDSQLYKLRIPDRNTYCEKITQL